MVKNEKRLFLFTYLSLMTLLVATVMIYSFSLGSIGILLSLLIAFAKATLVLRYFMELRRAQTAVLWFLGGTLFLVYVATLLSFSDYLTRYGS